MEAEEGISACPAGNGSSEGNVTEAGSLAIVPFSAAPDSSQDLQLAAVGKTNASTPEPAPRAQNGKSVNGNGKSINLHAFNLFASKVRPPTREQNPGATAHEIERLVGQKWATLPELEKAQFVEYAQKDHDNAVAKGLVSPTSGRVRRSRRRRSDTDADLPLLGRRKRGRPSKSEILLRQAHQQQLQQQQQQQQPAQQQELQTTQQQQQQQQQQHQQQQQQQQQQQEQQFVKFQPEVKSVMQVQIGVPTLQNQLPQHVLQPHQQQPVQQPKDPQWMQPRQMEVQQQYYLQQQKPWSPRAAQPSSRSRKRGAGGDGSRVSSPEQQFVGQKVQGVLDGAFSAGYFLTVRVGETNKVLRGLVFRPGASIPITPKNDVAPYVKVVKPVVEASFPVQRSPPPTTSVPLRASQHDPVMPPVTLVQKRQEEALSAETAQSPIRSAVAGAGMTASPYANEATPVHATGNAHMERFSVTPAAVSQDLSHQSSAGQGKPVIAMEPQCTVPLVALMVQVDGG